MLNYYIFRMLHQLSQDYNVYNGQGIYYPSVPEVIQIGENQFIEVAVAKMWRTEMLFGW